MSAVANFRDVMIALGLYPRSRDAVMGVDLRHRYREPANKGSFAVGPG